MNNSRLTFLTNDDYNYILQNEQSPVLVFFTAKWDDNSNCMMDTIEQLAVANYDKVKIYCCDIDQSPLCAAKANIVSIPCIAIYKNGAECAKYVGIKDKLQIQELLQKHEVI